MGLVCYSIIHKPPAEFMVVKGNLEREGLEGIGGIEGVRGVTIGNCKLPPTVDNIFLVLCSGLGYNEKAASSRKNMFGFDPFIQFIDLGEFSFENSKYKKLKKNKIVQIKFKEKIQEACVEMQNIYKSPRESNFYTYFFYNKKRFTLLMKLVLFYSEKNNIKEKILQDPHMNWQYFSASSNKDFLDMFLKLLHDKLFEIPELYEAFIQIDEYLKEKQNTKHITSVTKNEEELLKEISELHISLKTQKSSRIQVPYVDPKTYILEKSRLDYKNQMQKILVQELEHYGDTTLTAYSREIDSRSAFNPEEVLKKWMNDFSDINDCVKIICGDIGSGKSLLMKKLAMNFLDNKKVDFYYIPFKDIYNPEEHLEIKLSFIVYHYLKRNFEFQFNPLDAKDMFIVLLFDGLEEMPEYHGSTAIDNAKVFLEDLYRSLSDFNAQSYHVKVIISGRTQFVDNERLNSLIPREKVIYL